MGLLNMDGYGAVVMFLFQFAAYEAWNMNTKTSDEVECGFVCMSMDQCTHYVYDNNGYCDMADGRHVYNSTHQPHCMHVNKDRNETATSCNEFLIAPAISSSMKVVGLDGESVSTSTEHCRYVIAAKHEQSIKLELTYSCGNIHCNNDVIDVKLNDDDLHHMGPCFSTDIGSVNKNIGQQVTLTSMFSFILEFTRSINSSATLYGNIISEAPHATFCTNQKTTTTVATTVTRAPAATDTTTFLSTNDALSVSNGTTTDTTAGMGSTEAASTGDSGAETGVIVGAVLGSIFGLLVVMGTAFLVYWIIKRRPRGQIATKDIEMDDPVSGISCNASQKVENNLPATSP